MLALRRWPRTRYFAISCEAGVVPCRSTGTTSGEPFFLAGLWDSWHAGKPDTVASYILMTTEPNELAAKVHDRLPVMLHGRDVLRWLDPEVIDPEELKDLVGPYPAAEMASHPVSRRVNRPENEGPELIELDDSVRELWT
jgi:putative SOS response-associated peptidase YedK